MFGTGIGVALKKWFLEGVVGAGEFHQLRADIAEIKQHVYNLDVNEYRNIYKHSVRVSSESAARYWKAHMQGIQGVSHRDYVLINALDHVTLPGQRLEFGVYAGGSISYMATRHPEFTWHGFDSFEGLPEAWGFAPKATFDLAGKLPEVPSNVVLHKGWYSETAPAFFKENNEPIAFLHIDVDLYSSTKDVFDNCWHLLQPGSIIEFDEYWNYTDWELHEYKAFQEMIAEHNMEYEYISFNYCGEQVAVRITKAGS